MRENVGVSLPPTPRAKFLTPQVLKRCKLSIRRKNWWLSKAILMQNGLKVNALISFKFCFFFSGRFVRFLQKKLMNLKRKEGANFLVRWLLFGDCCSLHRKSAIHWSCVHWHFSSRQNLLPCFPWSYEFLTIRKCGRPEWAKDVVFEMSKNQFGFKSTYQNNLH